MYILCVVLALDKTAASDSQVPLYDLFSQIIESTR